MSLSFSLRFRKQNFANKILLEKEGEIVFDRQFFKLKGKGANDIGENVNFTDIKEIRLNKEEFIFTTFSKEKFTLCGLGSDFESFLEDFYRLKNEYFAENLFMKIGMLQGSFDCFAEGGNEQFGKNQTLGKGVIYFYEESIVLIPRMSDAQVFYLNFLKTHEFNDSDYTLTLENEGGQKLIISRLGSSFEQAQSILEKCLEKMYQTVLNQLGKVLPGFSVQILLKLAFMMRHGKAVSLNTLKKIDATLPQKMLELAFANNPLLEEKIRFVRGLDKDEQFYLGFSFESADYDIKTTAWFLCALPTLNTLIVGIASDAKDKRIFFFRIVMEQGMAADKVGGKILELNQCMILFENDFGPLYKDKMELRKTKYKVAVLKLAFLRLFRRSLLGVSIAENAEKFKDDANKYLAMAKVLHKPTMRHRQIFKSTLK